MQKIIPQFHEDTFTLTYLVYDEATKDGIIIDPVLDFDPAGGVVAKEAVSQLIETISRLELRVQMILETHAHADHLSASQELRNTYPRAVYAIGENIRIVQKTFKGIFNLGSQFLTDGSQFDRLLRDGEEVQAGSLKFKVIFTPGHTPACASYLFGDAVFTGDAIFMPDYGTGRCDFPDGSSEQLYDSIAKKLYALDDSTAVYVGHDYMPGARPLAFCSSIGEQKRHNIHIRADTTKNGFVSMRKERDRSLKAPRLLFPSIQVNINAGQLPTKESNAVSYLKIPLSTV